MKSVVSMPDLALIAYIFATKVVSEYIRNVLFELSAKEYYSFHSFAHGGITTYYCYNSRNYFTGVFPNLVNSEERSYVSFRFLENSCQCFDYRHNTHIFLDVFREQYIRLYDYRRKEYFMFNFFTNEQNDE